VLVDEAQFLTRDQVWQLARLTDRHDIPVICYGLRTDFQGQLFPGSAVLLGIADKLAEEGIECDVLDMRTIRPLDIDSIIASVKKTNRVVVVDQSWPFAGISSEVITQICEKCFDWLDHQPVRVNTEDVPTPYAKGLEYAYLPNPERIADAVKNILA